MMVDFFAQQQQAKRNTTLLVVLFVLAVSLIIVFITAASAVLMGYLNSNGNGSYQIHAGPLSVIAATVAGAIGLVMLVKWLQLKPGGHVVAESLGGIPIAPDSTDPLERRILNVVEEMAIAANMPVPGVYLLPKEAAINAFAAGYSSKDAVIGLTKGAVESFSREQLQAVVAHEFSHILNGDMRMNIRLIAALAGILALAKMGELLLRSARFSGRRNSKEVNPLPFIGLALLIVGWVGVLFGSIIKAAVSRQREYLADAAAVQFTRNPEALAGALKQIGARQQGSRLEHKNSSEAAHLFFGNAVSSWFSMMATHPPLEKRIKRLEPGWNGDYPEPQQAFAESQPGINASPSSANALNRLALLALPTLLLDHARNPQQAPALVRQILAEQTSTRPHKSALSELSAAQLLALVELSMPALRLTQGSEKTALLADLERLASSNDLFHWCLYQLIARQLLPAKHFAKGLGKKAAAECTVNALINAEQGQAINYAELERAINRCAQWSPLMKQTIVARWLQVVQQDQQISATEQKLIATLCACIDEPLPDALLAPTS
jgi:Zn-dependent protease with chaperone function